MLPLWHIVRQTARRRSGVGRAQIALPSWQPRCHTNNTRADKQGFLTSVKRQRQPRTVQGVEGDVRSSKTFRSIEPSQSSWNQRVYQAIPVWFFGMLIATPLVALGQGSLLLLDYRSNHAHAPHPDMPRQGVVVARSDDYDHDTTTDDIGYDGDDARHSLNGSDSINSARPSLYEKSRQYLSNVQRRYTMRINARRRSQEHRQQQQNRNRRPLRILVVGDSLAVGVGTHRSSTPRLPQAVAQTLSRAMGGRVVYWTCVGSPGLSAHQVVHEISQIHVPSLSGYPLTATTTTTTTNPVKVLSQKLKEWQIESTRRAEETKRRAREWWEHQVERQQAELAARREKELAEQEEAQQQQGHVIRRWWNTASGHIRKQTIQGMRRVGKLFRDDDNNHHQQQQQQPRDALQRHPTLDHTLDNAKSSTSLPTTDSSSHALTQRRDSFDPNVVGPYDIAIVLTGLNDLKETFLPFLMPQQHVNNSSALGRTAISASSESSLTSPHPETDGNFEESGQLRTPKDQGFEQRLVRIVHALQDKMHLYLPATGRSPINDNESKSTSESDSNALQGETSLLNPSVQQNVITELHHDRSDTASTTVPRQDHHGPLVVFPALPVSPLRLSHIVPLCWFAVPLLRSIDRKKEWLQRMYPDFVLYIAAPSPQVFHEAELKTSPLWADDWIQEGRSLSLTDIAQSAKERLEDVMKQHYQQWVKMDSTTDDDCIDLLELQEGGDSVVTLQNLTSNPYPGASLISADGIHPNDEGYEMWGRFLAFQILDHLEKRNL